MPKIEDLIEDLSSLKETIQDAVDRAIIGDSFDIAEINREQLLSGFDSAGNALGEYAESTKRIRQKRGLQIDHIDLKFTGYSQAGLGTSKLDDNKYQLTTNPRWDEKRFPEAIGIQEANEDKVTDIIVINIEAVLDQKLL